MVGTLTASTWPGGEVRHQQLLAAGHERHLGREHPGRDSPGHRGSSRQGRGHVDHAEVGGKIQYRPHVIDGCLAGTGLTIEPW